MRSGRGPEAGRLPRVHPASLVPIGLLVSALAAPAFATTAMVMSLAPGRAELVVNGGAVRLLRDGQTSPEGVVLISATRDAAVLEVDGKRYTLGLGGGTISTFSLRADARGHFFATVHINGVPAQAVVDTGASDVALNRLEAQRVGVSLSQARRGMVSTANGQRPVWLVTLPSVQLGDIVIRNVSAAVLEGGPEQLPFVLLGNSLLQHLELQRIGDTLTIVKRW